MKNTISAADYENAWRPNFEMKAACWWGAGALGYSVYAAIGDFPSGPLLWMAGGCAALAAKSLVPGLRLMRTQLRLIGKPPATATFDELRKICSDPAHSNDMWLGRGFLWHRGTRRRFTTFCASTIRRRKNRCWAAQESCSF